MATKAEAEARGVLGSLLSMFIMVSYNSPSGGPLGWRLMSDLAPDKGFRYLHSLI